MKDVKAETLVSRARSAQHSGRAAEARALWSEFVSSFPSDPRALFMQGRRHLEAGDPGGALPLLVQAEALDPNVPEIPFFIAVAHRHLSEPREALAAIERALALEPYFFMALLTKGALLEAMGKPRLAARIYRNVIKIAPPEDRMPPNARRQFQHARDHVAANAQALAEHLRGALGEEKRPERFDECLDILAGVKRAYIQEPVQVTYPRLPAIPFFERKHFKWLKQLEAATPVIQRELEFALQDGRGALTPYIQYAPGTPVNQWIKLNHSPAWSTYFLWRDGEKQDANCARCPETTALLESLPMADQPGYAPTAMFSVLAPHTHIPPHTGSANTRVIVHLPLILPEKCRFRVGNDIRDWRMGEAWVFDDTIEHEAWNDSDETRVILIFDVWNPLLSEQERALVNAMMTAYRAYSEMEY